MNPLVPPSFCFSVNVKFHLIGKFLVLICLTLFVVLLTSVEVLAQDLSAAPPSVSGVSFEDWLKELRQEAILEGIAPAVVDQALEGAVFQPRVIDNDRNQPEFKLVLDDYLARLVSENRIRNGRLMLSEHERLLQKIEKAYKVQARFLLALWGIESDYGRVTGSHQVIKALVTLAFDNRRGPYFRKELLTGLHILNDGLVAPADFIGSWAGAYGGLQFMPSVFKRYAVDYDGDGRIDIRKSPADLFASGASYLHASGWRFDQTWGREIRLPAGVDRELSGTTRTLQEWQSLGLRSLDGKGLPLRDFQAKLIFTESDSTRAFLVYDNFKVILKWNRSNAFAIAVGTLADRLVETGR
ncbi:MAG: lytic murein transglycosylase [Proteobacteria bacterium]|nr:lytic murein transglycosylase [Pseudomonadota bacterium]MBU1688016.1 lytic murein transglycosylase [Pseudomonadota bacterium]